MGYWGHVDCKTWCHDTSSRISPLISKDLVHPVINFCFWRGKYFISCLLDSVIVKFNLIYSSHVQPSKGKNLSLIIFLFSSSIFSPKMEWERKRSRTSYHWPLWSVLFFNFVKIYADISSQFVVFLNYPYSLIPKSGSNTISSRIPFVAIPHCWCIWALYFS